MQSNLFIKVTEEFKNTHELLDELKALLIEQNQLRKEFLSFEEACKYLSVSSSFLYKKSANKEIPCRKPAGGRIYFLRTELDDWVIKDKPLSDEELDEKASAKVIEINNSNPQKQ